VEWLPLEIFDDSTFDDYTSGEEWIDLGRNSRGNQEDIPGKGL